MIHAQYKYSTNETGSQWSLATIGYFKTLSEARIALRGLCPWDFDTMWGFSDYKDFLFEAVPGTLRKADNKFIIERDKLLSSARKHANEWKGSWHHRAPSNWK